MRAAAGGLLELLHDLLARDVGVHLHLLPCEVLVLRAPGHAREAEGRHGLVQVALLQHVDLVPDDIGSRGVSVRLNLLVERSVELVLRVGLAIGRLERAEGVAAARMLLRVRDVKLRELLEPKGLVLDRLLLKHEGLLAVLLE